MAFPNNAGKAKRSKGDKDTELAHLLPKAAALVTAEVRIVLFLAHLNCRESPADGIFTFAHLADLHCDEPHACPELHDKSSSFCHICFCNAHGHRSSSRKPNCNRGPMTLHKTWCIKNMYMPSWAGSIGRGTSGPSAACSTISCTCYADPDWDLVPMQLGVQGMHCASCSTAVERALRYVDPSTSQMLHRAS